LKLAISSLAKQIKERRATVTAFIFLLSLNFASIFYVSAMTGRASLERAQSAFSPTLFDGELGRPSDRKLYERALAKVIQNSQSEEARALNILAWVMDQVPLVRSDFTSRSSWELVEHARKGGGLSCGGMAQILHDALVASDIPARRVALQTDLIGLGEGHVVVEALVDGRWIVFDPTFHVTLRAHNRRISAIEAQELTQKIGHNSVQIEFLGETKYPARTKNYYYNYLSLYRYVFVEARMGRLSRMPVINYWVGPVWKYREISVLSKKPILAYQILYHFSMGILPASIFLILVFMLLRGKSIRHKK
jgi:hypothetical protein